VTPPPPVRADPVPGDQRPDRTRPQDKTVWIGFDVDGVRLDAVRGVDATGFDADRLVGAVEAGVATEVLGVERSEAGVPLRVRFRVLVGARTLSDDLIALGF